jgi:hypothetical protein
MQWCPKEGKLPMEIEAAVIYQKFVQRRTQTCSIGFPHLTGFFFLQIGGVRNI